MSDFHPVRQAAEADFLAALEYLGNTFGALDDSPQASSEPVPPFSFEDLEPEDIEPMLPLPSSLPPEAIAEGYDKQAVKNPEVLGGKD